MTQRNRIMLRNNFHINNNRFGRDCLFYILILFHLILDKKKRPDSTEGCVSFVDFINNRLNYC